MSDVTVHKGIRSYCPRIKMEMNHYSKLELSTAMRNYLQVCSKNSNVVYHKHHILNTPVTFLGQALKSGGVAAQATKCTNTLLLQLVQYI